MARRLLEVRPPQTDKARCPQGLELEERERGDCLKYALRRPIRRAGPRRGAWRIRSCHALRKFPAPQVPHGDLRAYAPAMLCRGVIIIRNNTLIIAWRVMLC